MVEQSPLKKLDEWRWIIPKQAGMHTEGMIFASEKMLKHICEDKAHQQVANVAYLPGIVGRSLAMPDIHWGYGFAIGGVAAFDISKGVISPGGVGYDINCLSGDTLILTDLGYTLKIKDFEKIWENKKIVCFDFNKDIPTQTKIQRFIKLKPQNNVYEVKTESGLKIVATEDHPFWTLDGMKPIKQLKIGQEIAGYFFKGVPYEQPTDEIIIDRKDIIKKFFEIGKETKGNALNQILKFLEKNQCLTIKYNSEKLPLILKIMGYLFGDGNIHFLNKTGKGVVSFYGEKKNLSKIKKDIETVGWKCSKIYKRNRETEIKTYYKTYKFKRTEYWCTVRSSSFALLLATLGVPVGNKTKTSYSLPEWLYNATLWQKRLFLSSFFGAEMSTPKTMKSHGYNFYCPVISMNKKEEHLESGIKFLEGISNLLNEFGIKTKEISYNKEHSRLRLLISNKTENLINLYSKIGFEYNSKRKFISDVAIAYLVMKKKIIETRNKVERYATKLCGTSVGAKKIYDNLPEKIKDFINIRFIERSLYEKRKSSPRIALKWLKFDDFLKKYTSGLGKSGMVWDRIVEIKKVEFDDFVYDFTVKNKNHNFVANNFVVSNCGVRLLRTNLKKEDIKPKLQELIYELFRNIPSGVGSTGKISLSREEVKHVLNNGAHWAVKKGYGSEEDLKHTEETGKLEGADASKVSQRALERGHEQLGTLGAGNHFLEIQFVEEIYDPAVASVFGLFKDQVTILIHTGSRGLGYQICDDYIRILQNAIHKYNIPLPDRQLICAPVESPEGKDYFSAMAGAANYAWANRQLITHWVRQSVVNVLGKKQSEIGLEVVYDVAHNIGKFEEHIVEGKKQKLIVHRKGATRAFPAGSAGLPDDYRSVGQPVLIPGTMGTASYVLVGTQKALQETWGSTCHGAGRTMSRTQILKQIRGEQLANELANKGIIVKSESWKTLAEEAPQAYKDVDLVVDVCHQAGISRKVARMRPLGVIKG